MEDLKGIKLTQKLINYCIAVEIVLLFLKKQLNKSKKYRFVE